jgi:HK97 family phage prohead protease
MPLQLSNDVLEGLIVPYGRNSHPWTLDSGRKVYECILPGAFAESVAAIAAGKRSVAVNVEHSAGALLQLGRSGQNATIEETPAGPWLRLKLLGDDSVSQDLARRIRAGIVTGLSVEMAKVPPPAVTYRQASDGYIREISRAELVGVAVTAAGFYPDAQCTVSEVRSADAAAIAAIAAEVKAFERLMAGCELRDRRAREAEQLLLRK